MHMHTTKGFDAYGRMLMYHVTWEDSLESIIAHGLEPGDPGAGDDNPAGTYLFSTLDQAEALAAQRAEASLSDMPVIIQVDVGSLDLIEDPTWGAGSYFTTSWIEPVRIDRTHTRG